MSERAYAWGRHQGHPGAAPRRSGSHITPGAAALPALSRSVFACVAHVRASLGAVRTPWRKQIFMARDRGFGPKVKGPWRLPHSQRRLFTVRETQPHGTDTQNRPARTPCSPLRAVFRAPRLPSVLPPVLLSVVHDLMSLPALRGRPAPHGKASRVAGVPSRARVCAFADHAVRPHETRVLVRENGQGHACSRGA